MVTENFVRERFKAMAKSAQTFRCFPVEYDSKYLKDLPAEYPTVLTGKAGLPGWVREELNHFDGGSAPGPVSPLFKWWF